MGRMVLCEIDLFFQNGKITHAKDSLDDDVPASIVRDRPGLSGATERLRNMIQAAERSFLFGSIKARVVVEKTEILAFRCRRERSTKK